MNGSSDSSSKPQRPRASDQVTGRQLVTLLQGMPLEAGVTPYFGDHRNEHYEMQLVLGWDCAELGAAVRLVFADKRWTAIRPNESYLWEEVRLHLTTDITHSIDVYHQARAAGLFSRFCYCGKESECPQLVAPTDLLAALTEGIGEFRKALLMRDYDNIAQAIMSTVRTLPVMTLPLPGVRPKESAPDYPDVELPC